MRPPKIMVIVLRMMVLFVVVLIVLNILPLIRDRNHNAALGREWTELLKKQELNVLNLIYLAKDEHILIQQLHEDRYLG